MKLRFFGLLYLAALLSPLPSLTSAQTVGGGTQPPETASIPRTMDGKPDLSGIWQVLNRANDNILAHTASEGVPAGLGVVVGDEIPYRPEALLRKEDNFANRGTRDTEANCYLPGVPRITYMPFPFQIIQLPDVTTFLYEYVHATRYVYTNGSEHPDGPINWWMGDSRGHWDGDTLVVDVVHFTDQTWLDRAGNFHSENLHVVERYTLVDADHISYEVTIEDPDVFTRPWTMRMTLYRRTEPNFQLLEYDCYAFEWEQYYPYPGL
ncbi:MAG: hypothetical protein OEQ25_10085 [Gammaproteobacteria bacterium]|nr:hypothetical protein [Gammaproteobacteria bacterium]MDH3507475.1 hypothetical protein [Gammaproteobacteria bacterium]